mmetsp:Transcript_14410/g.31233  ORF Transcript_14410/g.31233 Transcript_14410/m.31233 type:complete len:512 (-) Transcript_14410:277-1812(-)|eukprot:CAMPEP_0172299764 /NCGR_PEP_ID=MMETSP1058-20130122/1989_1 /TAXON_ID=83371 /ORGANISM="Detonula confervacea, Strain CCMP 353" /LENGTH=511 /DNA_ID=CAMNT_0013009319 /DNA_START=92 /DNA_END=1627 /DNA_ORIENTATION=+
MNMVLPMISSRFSPHPWGIPSAPPTSATAKSYSSSCCGFVCPPALSSLANMPSLSTSSTATTKLHSTNKSYSAEWIDLLSHEAYSSPSTTLPMKIDPPRSGAVSFSTPSNDKIFTFAGYAEIDSASSAPEAPPERYAVNDLWQFVPYPEESTSDENASWGWTKVLQREDDEYIPGPRLASAIAVLPSTGNDDNKHENSQAVLLGGWDPQTPGTGGIILDDVSLLDLDSLEWSRLYTTSANDNEEEVISTIPGGPTSRHVAVPLSIKCPEKNEIRNTICLHNHRCEDHVLLLSTTTADGEGENVVFAQWEHQPTTGDAPSSRGLHCAAPLKNKRDNTSKAMVIFGGAAKDGVMSNEACVLDVRTWRWTRLHCGGDGNDSVPSPRAGACLCPLDENSVVLFGGATPGENGGLVGLNDVWVLHVDMEGGKGKWHCLSSNQNSVGDVCPPGRNAAVLSEIDVEKLLPNNIVWKQEGVSSSADDEKEECVDFLLQGGWYPFRKTYNDVFLLRISCK